MKPVSLIFLLLLVLPLSQCGGGTDGNNEVVVLPGTMILVTSPQSLQALKFGLIEGEEQVELETKMTVQTEETEDTVQLKVEDFEAEGEFPTEGPVKVKLNPEGDSSGMVYKLDENDQPLGPHQMQLDLIVEINDQELKFNDIPLGGFSEEVGLELEVAPIEYRTGSESTHVMKINGLTKFVNIVLKHTDAVELPVLPQEEN